MVNNFNDQESSKTEVMDDDQIDFNRIYKKLIKRKKIIFSFRWIKKFRPNQSKITK